MNLVKPGLVPTRDGERRDDGSADRPRQKGTRKMTDNRGKRGKSGVTRRSFLKAGASTAALFGAVNTQFPFGVPMALADGPEVTKATLGFIALTDAAPLF